MLEGIDSLPSRVSEFLEPEPNKHGTSLYDFSEYVLSYKDIASTPVNCFSSQVLLFNFPTDIAHLLYGIGRSWIFIVCGDKFRLVGRDNDPE